jgi:hypothetical protein
MWKVVVTEIQDAGTLEPTRVPPGAFSVSTERFSQTVDDLDLQALSRQSIGCRPRRVAAARTGPFRAERFSGGLVVHFVPRDSVERTEQAWNRRDQNSLPHPSFPKLIHDLQ